MRLGLMQREDRASVARLLSATGAFSHEEIDVALELFDEVHTEHGHDHRDYEFLGAFNNDGTVVAFACFGATPSTSGTYDLYWLAVHPDVQGGGTGRSLVDWVERDLERRGARLLVVETSSRADYQRTRQFYARRGYAEAARVRDYYAPADDRIILSTRLTPREVGAPTR
ncbi:MAG: GNAT family N-acetyltransferase [bacterium]